MKILHLVCTAPPYKGGMGNSAVRLANAQSLLGYNVAVIAPGKPTDSEGLTVFHRPWLKIGNGAFVPQFFRVIKFYDVIHFHYPFFGSHLVVLLACFFYDKPLVVHYHMDVEVPGIKKIIVRFNSLFIEPLIIGYAARVIGSSLDYLRHSRVSGYLEKYTNKFAAIPFGVDESRFKPGSVKRAEILFVGGLDRAHYFKGVPVLLDAVAKLITDKRWPRDFKLQIAGDGDMRSDYEKYASLLKLEGVVYFSGKVTDEQLLVAYREAQVLVLPSINRGEAFGLVLLEAMSSGTPVIATNLPGVRTVFSNGIEGIQVEPGNTAELALAIDKFINDRHFAATAAIQARRLTLKKYNWAVIAKQFICEYDRIDKTK